MTATELRHLTGLAIAVQVHDGEAFAWASDDSASTDVIRSHTVATAFGPDASTALSHLAEHLGVPLGHMATRPIRKHLENME